MSRIVQNKIPVVEVYSIHSVTSTEGTDQTTVFGKYFFSQQKRGKRKLKL